MPIKARCPTCGKSARFPDTDLGLPAVCAACGARYMLPRYVSREGPTDSTDRTVDAPKPGFGLGWVGWMIVGVAVISAGLAVAIVLTIGLRPPTYNVTLPPSPPPPAQTTTTARPPAPLLLSVSDADAQKILTLKADAEALAVDGLYKDAHRKYREIETIIAGRRITDPGVRDIIESARADRESIFRRFIHPSDPTASDTGDPLAPATTSPTTSPAATQAVALSKRPPLNPVPEKTGDDTVSDAQIGQAITKGTKHLLSLFNETTNSLSGGGLEEAQSGGSDALAVYALLQAGRATNDPRLSVRNKRMEAMIEAMKKAKLGAGHPQTYARGIRATALALFDRPQDRGVLKEDVTYLLKSHKQGAYTYNLINETVANPPVVGPNGFRFKGEWDNSNSQYGLLGVWAGADTGAVPVPRNYWSFVEQHWVGSQNPDGTWAYKEPAPGLLSMTVAGVASLFVTQDYLYGTSSTSAAASRVGRPPFSSALRKALKWLEEEDHILRVDETPWPGYTFYGVERAGLASGFKYFGAHDWYRKLAARLVKRQNGDGGWGDVNDTSFCLLFLSRGRHPVLMNKLRFDASEGTPNEVADVDAGDVYEQVGFWNNHPRDLANLSRLASRQLERELNFQVVPLKRDFTEWLDSPILYLASHRPPRITEDDKRKLKAYVEAGGLLFTHADGDAPEFNQFAESLANTLFGDKYEMRDLPSDHPVYRLVFKVSDPPRLRAVSNGSRLLMLHAPVDVARFWQARDDPKARPQFDFGTNLFLYAAGKRDLRNRLDSPYVSEPAEPPPNGKVAVARLSYSGNWDPEPGAFTRFGRWLHRETGTGVDVKPVPLSSLSAQHARTLPIAHVTGTEKVLFTDSDAKALRAYVDAGGVAVLDPCGGSAAFRDSASQLVAKAFADVRPREVGAGHPLVTFGPPGMEDLAKPRVRPYATQAFKEVGPGTISTLSSGKGHVVLLSLDLTSGLLGTATWGIAGYEPSYAQDLLKNVIFWTLDGQRER